MTLENTLLEKLSEWQSPAGRKDLHVAVDNWAVTVTADRSDALGCLLWEVNLCQAGTAEVDVEKWAAAVVNGVTGLMEPLKIVEIDATRKIAQLRSETPSERGGKRLYYELLLSSIGHAALRRYQAVNAATGREQVAFAVTHETLAQLAGDVTGAA